MRAKSMVLMMIALGCGLVASIGISEVIKNRKGNSGGAETEKIIVAMENVDIGQVLTAQIVQLEEWPKDRVPVGALRDLADIEGRRPRTRMFAGEPVLEAKLIDPNNPGGTAETIPEGYRVQSVEVTMETAVSNLLKPGDRVDVLAFVKRSMEAGVRQTGTFTILRNVRVFAINAQVSREIDADGNAIDAKTVSLLVTPEHAERLMLAGELGTLQLTMRSPGDETDKDANSEGATAGDLFGTGDRDDSVAQPTATLPPQISTQMAPPPPGGGIMGKMMGMLAGMSAGDDESWTMDIHTRDGVDRWRAASPDELPQRLTDETVAPVQMPQFPVIDADAADPLAEPEEETPEPELLTPIEE